MRKRKSNPARTGTAEIEVRPGDEMFVGLVDDLALLLAYDPEKEYDARIAEGERQLEIIAAQIEAQQKRELARRAECRAKRLEREAVEKAAAGGKSAPRPRNRVRKTG